MCVKSASNHVVCSCSVPQSSGCVLPVLLPCDVMSQLSHQILSKLSVKATLNSFFDDVEQFPFPKEELRWYFPQLVEQWTLVANTKSVSWDWVMLMELSMASFLSSTESTAVGKHLRRGLVILVASRCDIMVKPDSPLSTRTISGARALQRRSIEPPTFVGGEQWQPQGQVAHVVIVLQFSNVSENKTDKIPIVQGHKRVCDGNSEVRA